MNNPKIIVALDFATQKDALALVDRLDPKLCRLKVGKELFTVCRPCIGRNSWLSVDLRSSWT